MAKMTKKEMFALIAKSIEAVENLEQKEEILEFCNHEVELLNKKHSTGKTKTQKLNEQLIENLFNALSTEENPVTITQLIKGHPEELINPEKQDVMTNQKASALMKKLVEAGRVEKTVEKGMSLFATK